jgi:hypothetical protein
MNNGWFGAGATRFFKFFKLSYYNLLIKNYPQPPSPLTPKMDMFVYVNYGHFWAAQCHREL